MGLKPEGNLFMGEAAGKQEKRERTTVKERVSSLGQGKIWLVCALPRF